MSKAKQTETGFVPVFPSTVAALPGVTARPTIADEATAARLVASRAFTYEATQGSEEPVDVLEFDEAERPALDLWVSPIAHGDHYKNPPAGPAAAPEPDVDDDAAAAPPDSQ